MSIKQAIEALEVAQDALDISQSLQESAKSNHHPKTLAAYERVSAAIAALRSMPQGEPVPAKNNDVDLLLRAVFELCEATEEAPQVEPRNEHQRGFDKGRRFEAKAIRRAVGDWFQATFCGQSFMGEPVLTKPEVPHCIDGACHLCATPPTEAVRMSEAWQPIETAPLDGKPVLAFWPPSGDFPVHGGCYGVARWYEGTWCNPEDDDDDYIEPTHWQPLPPPPVEQATAARLGVKMGDV